MSDFDEIAAEGEKSTTETDLASITALALKQLELEGDLGKAEEVVKTKKEELRRVKEGQLPDAMKAAKMTTFGLENGMTVSYKEDLKVSVPQASKPKVVKTMKEWGYAGDVKNVLTVDLGKGSDNVVAAFKALAEELGVDVTVTEDIATPTVKKALNARIKEGKNDDLKLFGAFQFTQATVK